VLLEHDLQGGFLQPAGIARMAVVLLLSQLVAGDVHAVGVDDDHEVPGVHVGGVLGLVLALQDRRDLRGETPKRKPFGVHHPPVAFDLGGLGDIGVDAHLALHFTAGRLTARVNTPH